MAPEVKSAAVKVLLLVVSVAVIMTAARFRRLSLPEVFGFRPAKWSATLLRAGAAAACMLPSNALLGWRGSWDFESSAICNLTMI